MCGLDEVLARLDLVEVLPRSHRLRGVADVAGTRVPVALYIRDGLVLRAANQASVSAGMLTEPEDVTSIDNWREAT